MDIEGENKKVSKSLMRLENPIYELQKKDESETDYVLRVMMSRKPEKPQIVPIGRSPLLSQLDSVFPIFKKANEELLARDISEVQKIDAQLQQVESSSSDEEGNEGQSEGDKMEDAGDHQMQQEKQEKEGQIELNFMRYPYPEKMVPLQEKTVEKEEEAPKKKKKLIQEL